MAEDLSMKSLKCQDLNIENQVDILTALINYKPVGVSRHFNMIGIQEFVNEKILNSSGGSTNKEFVSCDQIWNFINTLYDLKTLEPSEPLPFPNENVEFQLPFGEFGQFFKERKRSSIASDKDETSSNPEDTKRKADDTSSRSSTPAKKIHHR